jgi:hypothetical protein
MRLRMTAKLHEVSAEIRRSCHLPIPDQGRWLAAVLRGHYAYYGVPTNSVRLTRSGARWRGVGTARFGGAANAVASIGGE